MIFPKKCRFKVVDSETGQEVMSVNRLSVDVAADNAMILKLEGIAFADAKPALVELLFGEVDE